MTETHSPYKGVFAAVLTPVKPDLSADLDRMAAHCKWLLANGCDGLGVLGTTGEANSFGLKERIGIIEGLVERGVPADVMMPGTGCCATPDTVALTKATIDIGAKGVLMLPPFYYKNNKDEGLFAAFSDVIQRVGDDRLKIFLYHFPQVSNVPITFNLIEMLLKAYPKTVVGMKDSSGDLENMAGAAERFPGFASFSGSDENMLPLMRRGGVGCITACANVVSPTLGEMYAGIVGKRPAAELDKLNEKLIAIRKMIAKYPLAPSLKALMARHTGAKAWLTVRPPMVSLSDAECKALYAEFDALAQPMAKAA